MEVDSPTSAEAVHRIRTRIELGEHSVVNVRPVDDDELFLALSLSFLCRRTAQIFPVTTQALTMFGASKSLKRQESISMTTFVNFAIKLSPMHS